jgi:hypothetical protein
MGVWLRCSSVGVPPQGGNLRLHDLDIPVNGVILSRANLRKYARLGAPDEDAFAPLNGVADTLGKAIGLMYDLKVHAIALMRIPFGNARTAAPCFEYVQ